MNTPRLLVLTQVVDTDDPVLGFFHGWLRAFATRFPHIHVVCLKKGAHSLPNTVDVHSLGKEEGKGRIVRVLRFYKYVWSLRHEYDAVFVHMNPEYVVLGGVLWRLMGKHVYMWRNHWASGLLTDLAVFLSHKTFCTSKASHIAKYKKNVLMPVGIDADRFQSKGEAAPDSILSLGRVAPSKNIHVILEALKILLQRRTEFTASVYGDALPKDREYLEAQKRYVAENGLSGKVTFYPGVKNADTPGIYSSHRIFINASASGMFDKTIFEAILSGATSIACSEDYRDFAGRDYWFEARDSKELADSIERHLSTVLTADLRDRVVREHSLAALVIKLDEEMSV